MTPGPLVRLCVAVALGAAVLGCSPGDDGSTDDGSTVAPGTTSAPATTAAPTTAAPATAAPTTAPTTAAPTTEPVTTEPVTTDGAPTTDGDVTSPTGEGPTMLARTFDERGYGLVVPSAAGTSSSLPLVMMLHGYSASGAVQEDYFALSPLAEEHGFLLVAPDGMLDVVGNRFWNATTACCDFAGAEVDDVGHLLGIIEEISDEYDVDPDRVHLVGHSNGGFMSYRMACEHADVIASIVSLAGATFVDPDDCQPSEPVGIVQIHGTLDTVISFDGGATPIGGPYPSATDTVAAWASSNGCDDTSETSGPVLDLDAGIGGDDTTVTTFAGCPPGGLVELWTIEGGSHVPPLSDDFRAAVVEALLERPKPSDD